MRAGLVMLAAVAMVALLAGVSEAQNTYIYTPEGTYTVHAIPSGVDNNGVPLGLDSGKGRDSYTNYTVTPPSREMPPLSPEVAAQFPSVYRK